LAGTAFGPGGEGFLRLSYAAALPDLERALARIAAVLASRTVISS
jgi:aminotransferase